MANYCFSELVITGATASVQKLIEQVGKPYTHKGEDGDACCHEGVFLLWNIVSPTDLEEYEKDAVEPDYVPEEVGEKFLERVKNSNTWYFWNYRNWGTKWEVAHSDARVVNSGHIVYRMATAWSPAEHAIDALSKQYPDLIFTLRSTDEVENFACEIHWVNGKRVFDGDIKVTHSLWMELVDGCPHCTENAEVRSQYGCDIEERVAKFAKQLNDGLSNGSSDKE
jgi:Ferredoxin-like domain in Api92-like protein